MGSTKERQVTRDVISARRFARYQLFYLRVKEAMDELEKEDKKLINAYKKAK